MGGHFLLLIPLFIGENLALTCLPREYISKNICCPMCDKGFFVKAHCTLVSGSSVCVVCAEGTYMDHPNGLPECFRCRECDNRANLIVKEKCTTTSNTVCECKANHFCQSHDCDMCQEHAKCPAGQYIKKNGTGELDTVCEECPLGHFSNISNSARCIPWDKCSGLVLHKEGNSTTDSICKEHRTHGFIGFAVLCLAVVVLLLCKQINTSKQQKKELHEYKENFPLSIEEKEVKKASANTSIEET